MASIADSTDPGTRRPDEASFSQSGAYFQPILIPPRSKKLNSFVLAHANDPLALWQCFFPPEQLNLMLIYTNSHARLYYEKCIIPYARARPWKSLTMDELYAYLAAHIYMGLHKEPRISDYWNTRLNKPIHPIIYRAISLVRFQQIDRFFHCTEKSISGNPFSNLEPLNSHVMKAAKELWQAGRDLAVDECIQRFQGQSVSLYSVYRLI